MRSVLTPSKNRRAATNTHHCSRLASPLTIFSIATLLSAQVVFCLKFRPSLAAPPSCIAKKERSI
ncbi:hypothetical protein A2U01_0077629 [Trifolium medium]|uniref:Uncharacterized protein n=1 Tax=Trifolium medium TaxID=97028 RepID=A0A392T5M2_9FABA|nr:hypothetical protein [Trifolium medium]